MERSAGSSDFVGRQAELAELERALDAAKAGSPPVILVHGEAGIGKTRLLSEFATSASQHGATVLRGTCYEGGAGPYGPWVEAIADHLGVLASGEVSRTLGDGAPVLAALVPGIARTLPETARPAPLASVDGRIRLYEVITSLLAALPAPVVIVLDDLQWAEPASLDLLGYVARFAEHALIVGSYRGSDLGLDEPLTRRLADINRRRPCRYMLLSSLPPQDASELLARIAGRTLEPRTEAMLYTETAGNPFFLAELGRHLRSHGLPARGPSGSWRLPETVRGAISLRVASVSPETRAVLEQASVFSAGIEFSPLRALAELEEAPLLDCLDEALRVELLKATGPERYDFSHALVRHALYEQFSPSRRARLHRRLAEVLESCSEPRRPDVHAELARQYHASASLSGAQRGVTHALAAAERAREVHASDEAAGFLQIALDLLPADDHRARGPVLGALAVAQAEASLIRESLTTLDAAITVLQRIDVSPDQIADVVNGVVSVLAMAYVTDETVSRLIARGISALGATRDLAWARLKLLEHRFERIPAGQVTSLHFEGLDPEAIRIARSEGSPADFVRTIDIMQWTGLDELARLTTEVQLVSDEAAQLRGLDVITMSLALRYGAPPATEPVCERVRSLATKMGSLATQAMTVAYRGAILGARGELGASEASFGRCAAIAERVTTSQIAAGATLMRAMTIQHIAPDWAALGEQQWSIATDPDQVVWFSIAAAALAAYAFARADDRDRAIDVLGQITPALLAHDPTDFVQSAAVGEAAAAIWELRAQDLAEALLPAAQALIDAEPGDWYMNSNQLTSARLHTVLGRPATALDHFEAARAELDRQAQRPLRAIVDLDEAVARSRFGRPGTARLLAAAVEQFTALGMTGWRARAEQPQRSARLPDGITRREAEVMRLLAAGHTNKQIAASLVLSVFTVERHLANAYRKIEVRNRADAAVYVVRHDL